jgi:acyl transferase domain-containing protein
MTDDIAIIGMSGRFPGAENLAEFWDQLCAGVETMKDFSAVELQVAGVSEELLSNPDYVKTGIVWENADEFDAGFFGMSPREAEITDPQHRIFLECAWEALENAGHAPSQFKGSIGVFASANTSMYLARILADPELLNSVGGFQAVLGCDKDYMPLRTAFKLNLCGPAIAVQTSCSSSLVAVLCRRTAIPISAAGYYLRTAGAVRLTRRRRAPLAGEEWVSLCSGD